MTRALVSDVERRILRCDVTGRVSSSAIGCSGRYTGCGGTVLISAIPVTKQVKLPRASRSRYPVTLSVKKACDSVEYTNALRPNAESTSAIADARCCSFQLRACTLMAALLPAELPSPVSRQKSARTTTGTFVQPYLYARDSMP